MRKLLTAGLVLTMMALVPNTSDAAPIFGSIELTGPMAPTGGTTLNDATGVDFTANAGVFVAGSGVYDPAVSGFSFHAAATRSRSYPTSRIPSSGPQRGHIIQVASAVIRFAPGNVEPQ